MSGCLAHFLPLINFPLVSRVADELVYQPLANALYFSPTSCQVVLQSLHAKGNGPMYALLNTVTDAVRGRAMH